MVWAIDLDDGTLIDALGANLDRKKKSVLPPPKNGWPDYIWPLGDDKEL